MERYETNSFSTKRLHSFTIPLLFSLILTFLVELVDLDQDYLLVDSPRVSTAVPETDILRPVKFLKSVCLALVLAPLCVSSAQSAKNSLAILVLPAPELGIATSEIYVTCRRAIEENSAFRVTSLDVFSQSLKQDVVRECAGNSQCFARKMRESRTDAEWLLTVALDKLGDEFAVGLRLIEIKSALEKREDETVVSEMVPQGTEPLRGLTELLPKVFAAHSWGRLGNIVVDAEPNNAEILINEDICVSPCKVRNLEAGVHRVVVSMPGYTTQTREISLSPGQTQRIKIQLEAKPDKTPLGQILLWTGVGIGVIGAGLTTWLLTRESDIVEVCIAADEMQCGF